LKIEIHIITNSPIVLAQISFGQWRSVLYAVGWWCGFALNKD